MNTSFWQAHDVTEIPKEVRVIALLPFTSPWVSLHEYTVRRIIAKKSAIMAILEGI